MKKFWFKSAKLKLVLQTVSTVMLALILIGGGGAGGYYLRDLKAQEDAKLQADSGAVAGVDLSNFWQAWRIMDEKFYGGTDLTKQTDGAIAGMVSNLGDLYTNYLPPAQNKIFKADLSGHFGGIGAELEMRGGVITVVAPLQGTPAEAIGIKPLDVIYKINDQLTKGMNFNDAVNMIRGEAGTTVKLNIIRDGVEKPFDLTITRAMIELKSVVTEDLGSYSYIKVNQFYEDSGRLFRQYLEAAVKADKKGVVIDLRNDPGGLLEQAVAMIGMVLPDHPVSDNQDFKDRVAVKEKVKNGTVSSTKTVTTSVAPTMPLVVLVNNGSASASEIFAGAMQDYGRAKIVGNISFGKGSVQDLTDLSNGGSLKVTIAHWLTPLGSEINGVGIKPDVDVSLGKDEKMSSNDTQVKKALEQLP